MLEMLEFASIKCIILKLDSFHCSKETLLFILFPANVHPIQILICVTELDICPVAIEHVYNIVNISIHCHSIFVRYHGKQ